MATCYCCGEKRPPFRPDQSAHEIYVAMYEGHQEGSCRAIVICSTCMDKGEFDMWTNAPEWNSKNPLVPYHLLPPYDHYAPERDDVSKYPSPQELLDQG